MSAASSGKAVAFRRLGVIGCGLMGGSFALAMRAEGLVGEVIAAGPSRSSLDLAQELGVIDAIARSPAELADSVDLLMVAVPVVATEDTFKAIAPALRPDVLLMDMGSTKRDVVDTARRVLKAKVAQFVPAHPIAGSERSGVRHADVALFHGRKVILTPIAQTRPELVDRASEVWRAIGGQVLQMSAENHDAAFAAVSHLPHLLAFAYFSAIAHQPAGPEFLALAGPGFRDFTRIAASDPSVWRDILMTNREEVMRQSLRFRYALDSLERMMQDGDAKALEEAIRTASEARAGWHIGGGRPLR